MGFIDNIKSCFSAAEIPAEPNFRAVIFGENAIYLENIKSIASYNGEEIILSIKNGGLKIQGKELYIKKYCMGDMVICGKIKGIEKI